MPKKFRGTALIRVDRKQAKIVNVDDIDDVTINSLRQHMGYHVTYSSTELDNEGQPRRVLRRKIKTKFDYIRGTFPTGMVDRCRKELKRKRYKVKVLDRRPTIPLDEKAILGAIDTFPMHLRPYQIDAITTGLYNPQMIFHVCTGGGKTVLFDVISQMTSLKTLVIVDREDLLQQHYRSLKKTRPGEDIGLIRGKQLDFGERVCIATVQTIMSRLKRSRYRMDKYLKSVEYVILDECLTLDTNIILEDGGVKKIKDITNEDEVVGGTVSNFFKRKSEIYKIKSSYSHLKTSPTHKNIVLERKRKINIIEVETCNLDKRKHSLLVPYKIPHTVKNNLSVDKAAFIALIATDGSLGVSGNYGRVKIIYSKESKKFIDDIFIKGVKSFGYIDNEIKTYTDKKRKSKLIWTLSKDLLMDLNRLGVPSGKKGNIIKIPDEIFYAPIKTIKKFIDICFSCKGNISISDGNDIWNKPCGRLYFNSTSLDFVMGIQLLLKKIKIHSTFMEIKRKNRKHNTIYRLSVGNINFNKLLDSIKFSRKDFNTKFRNTGYKPYREVLYNGRKYISTNILKISKLKKRKMVADFTIEKTHTFLANGILTSNCHHGKSNTWRRIPALCSNAIYKHGFSGTPWDFASQNIELEAVCGPIKQRLTASALIKLGYLARPYITFHRYDGAGRLIDGQNLHTVYENGIMNNKHRNKKILEVVDHEYRENNAKLLLVVQRIKHGHILSDLLRKLGIHDREIGYLHGGSKGKVREEGRREFEKGDIRIMIVSNIWNEGIDIPSCDVLVKADAYGGGDVYEGEGVRSLLQQIGRVLRKPIPNGWDDVDTETEHTVRVHDFADKCHKWIENWTRNRMRSCKMEEEWVVDVK